MLYNCVINQIINGRSRCYSMNMRNKLLIMLLSAAWQCIIYCIINIVFQFVDVTIVTFSFIDVMNFDVGINFDVSV